jgi:hypothetical protein
MCVFLCVFCDVYMQCVYTDMFDHVRARQVDINHGCKYLLENNNLFIWSHGKLMSKCCFLHVL